jgi:hypothetical protein
MDEISENQIEEELRIRPIPQDLIHLTEEHFQLRLKIGKKWNRMALDQMSKQLANKEIYQFQLDNLSKFPPYCFYKTR